jgi:hypothetical protein
MLELAKISSLIFDADAGSFPKRHNSLYSFPSLMFFILCSRGAQILKGHHQCKQRNVSLKLRGVFPT